MNAHHKKKILAAASLILLSPMALLAHEGAVTYEKQEFFSSSKKKISGSIRDVDGNPIVGATILEKGTNNGAISDLNGNFTLEVAENSVLHISSMLLSK